MVPIHPSVVHFPIVLTMILPVLVLAFAFMIRTNKMSPHGWLIIIGLQLTTVMTGYIALETGETDEKIAEKVVSKKLIHAHEESAKIFVGIAVLALVTSIAVFFIRKDLQFKVYLVIMLINLIAGVQVWRVGLSGGELVYLHGAGSAHEIQEAPEGQAATPGKPSTESSMSLDENESLKVDDHEYNNEPPTDEEYPLEE
jgi:uncharacterized membrane protein